MEREIGDSQTINQANFSPKDFESRICNERVKLMLKGDHRKPVQQNPDNFCLANCIIWPKSLPNGRQETSRS